MKSHYELTPAEYESGRQGHLQRRRADLISGEVAALVTQSDLVVELGCGPGDVLEAVARRRPHADYLGIDIDDAMIEHARSTHSAARITFSAVDIVSTPFERRARLVFGIDVLHHVHDLGPFVDAVAALLEPRGMWLVIEPNSRNPYIWLHQERMRRAGLDEHHFRPQVFEREAERSGLEVIERTTAFVVPGFVGSVPHQIARAEHVLERIPFLGGSVVYKLSPA